MQMARMRPSNKAIIVSGLTFAIIAASGEAWLGSDQNLRYGNHHPCTGGKNPEATMCLSKKEDADNTDEFRVQTWNPLRLAVLRLGLTEPLATSPLNYGKYEGEFKCAYCGETLFDSNAKYDSGSGWPSFWRSASENAVQYKREMNGSLECQCKRCSSHLGHAFLDGPSPGSVNQDLLNESPSSDPRGRTSEYLPRYCINGAAIKYSARKEESIVSNSK
jgi:peptide-methionine (R)-S-oxide reductase